MQLVGKQIHPVITLLITHNASPVPTAGTNVTRRPPPVQRATPTAPPTACCHPGASTFG